MHNQELPASSLLLILATGRFFGEFGWGHPVRRRMRATLVIVYAPVLDFSPDILQRHKPVLVQTPLPQPAVERLNRGIIRGRSWPGEVNPDMPFEHPFIPHFSGKLRAIICFQELR